MKYCVYHKEKRCYHSACSIFDRRSGNVFVCRFHPNPNGILMRRRVKFSPSGLRCSK